jgi:hypothetical protein
MNLEQFHKQHLAGVTAKPKLFSLVPPDPPASDVRIAEVESLLGVNLPCKYRQFLRNFGGGIFGLTNVFSAYPGSDFYLPSRCADSRSYLPAGVVPFSDDGTGGLYVMKLSGTALAEPVFYWSPDGGIVTTEFEDIFAFVSRYAYSAA